MVSCTRHHILILTASSTQKLKLFLKTGALYQNKR